MINDIGRLDLINDRLQEIGNGNHLKIITEVDKRERPKKTMCIGINWNYEFQDIVEIAEVKIISSVFEKLLNTYSMAVYWFCCFSTIV
jgi:hypothetical protein